MKIFVIAAKYDKYLHRLLLAMLTFALFSQVLYFPFLSGWDDNSYVLKNVDNLNWTFDNLIYWLHTPCVGHYLPLTMFSYMFDYSLWGLNSFGFHLQNILWHIVTVLAVYECLLFFRVRPIASFFLAFIFAIHPQRVESVVWISERKDVLCAAFYFLSIVSYLKGRYSGRFNWNAFLLMVAAILSKPMAVSLPFVLLFCDVYFRRDFDFKTYLRKLWPYFAFIAVFLPFIFFVFNKDQDIPILAQFEFFRGIGTVLYNYSWYVLKTLFPVDLSPLYPRIGFTSVVLLELSVFYGVVCYLAFSYFKYRKENFLFDFIPIVLCYLVSLFPVSGIVPFGGYDHADRYSYIPSVFIIFIAGKFITHIYEGVNLRSYELKFNHLLFSVNKNLILCSGWIYILFLGGMNILYSSSWIDIYSLFTVASHHNPPNPLSIMTLAEIDMNNRNYESAFGSAEKLESLKGPDLSQEMINGNYVKANYIKGRIYLAMNEPEEAIRCFEKIKPYFKGTVSNYLKADHANILINMANSYLQLGKKDEAIACYGEIVEIGNPFEVHFYRGLINYFSDNLDEALKDFMSSLKYKDDKRAQENMNECKREIRERAGKKTK